MKGIITSGGRIKRMKLIWYESPKKQKDREDLSKWQMHSINADLLSGHGFVFADLDLDGDEDIVVGNADWDTPDHEEAIFWYENPGPKSKAIRDPWKEHLVFKNQMFFAKPQIGIGDIGHTPAGIASVFWMEYKGDKPEADNWETHVIKWSDGVFSGQRFQGEKWDHCRFVDLDEDGDLDIIGNCEEYYNKDRNTLLGVVWFENPTK